MSVAKLGATAPVPADGPPRLPGPTPLLPQPPSDQEKYAYTRRRRVLLVVPSVVGFTLLVTSQGRLMAAVPALLPLAPLAVFAVTGYLLSLRVQAFTPAFDLERHRGLVRDWQPERHPSVDVFLPVCGEPFEIIRNTWRHVRTLADAYPGAVSCLVLDDGASAELAALAAEFGFEYLVRPDRGRHKKAGNLRHGFRHSSGRYILVLDADFAPRPDLLAETVPYLEAEPRLGIVQSPQYFRILPGQRWIERGAGAVQELFYRSIQVSRNHHGASICVGSCAVYRREALAQNGGTTLIEHSEDVHTGFDLRALGWGLRYLPVNLATGTCPDNMTAFHRQQYRWCVGSMSLMRSRKFWTLPMPVRTRCCYLAGFCYYLHTALAVLLTPLLPLVLLIALPQSLRAANTLWILPAVLSSFLVVPLWHRAPYGPAAWSVRLLYGWAHLFALRDLLLNRVAAWQPTGSADARRSTVRGLRTAVVLWSGGTAVLWCAAALWRVDEELRHAPRAVPGALLLCVSGLLNLLIAGWVVHHALFRENNAKDAFRTHDDKEAR